jgi:hypothetical protein
MIFFGGGRELRKLQDKVRTGQNSPFQRGCNKTAIQTVLQVKSVSFTKLLRYMYMCITKMNVHKKWLPIVAEKTFIYSKILLILESK